MAGRPTARTSRSRRGRLARARIAAPAIEEKGRFPHPSSASPKRTRRGRTPTMPPQEFETSAHASRTPLTSIPASSPIATRCSRRLGPRMNARRRIHRAASSLNFTENVAWKVQHSVREQPPQSPPTRLKLRFRRRTPAKWPRGAPAFGRRWGSLVPLVVRYRRRANHLFHAAKDFETP